MKKLLLSFLLLSFLLFSPRNFAWNCEKKPLNGMYPFESFEEAVYCPAEDPLFKSATVPRFNFWFDLPLSWKAISASANGDGYIIITGKEPAVDISISGIYNVYLIEGDHLRTFEERDAIIRDFRFRDGTTGHYVELDDTLRFIMESQDCIVTLYISAPSQWRADNTELIQYVGSSLRWGQRE